MSALEIREVRSMSRVVSELANLSSFFEEDIENWFTHYSMRNSMDNKSTYRFFSNSSALLRKVIFSKREPKKIKILLIALESFVQRFICIQ